MVLRSKVFDYIESDAAVLKKVLLEAIAKLGQLMAYRHKGFLRCMDTQRDRKQLEGLLESGDAPWKKR